jgi:sulfide dehydrogenase cytochrome subunit
LAPAVQYLFCLPLDFERARGRRMIRAVSDASWGTPVFVSAMLAVALVADSFAHAQETAEPPAATSQPATPPGLLAASCANCHGAEGRGAWPIAAIAGRPYPELYRQLTAYRDGDPALDATVMGRLMAGYSDSDLETLARWFAAQPASAE